METVAVIDKEAVFDSLSAIFPSVLRHRLSKKPHIRTHIGNADGFLKG